ncbi:MAG: prepilin-type N-terminal cleavage/methylation domain-containing protein [Verrucomicrobia bacterium]|nr:prepilin-type N-terminal cleavage/methylation domain-containing protein [Verrucomicrobiota bacterium]
MSKQIKLKPVVDQLPNIEAVLERVSKVGSRRKSEGAASSAPWLRTTTTERRPPGNGLSKEFQNRFLFLQAIKPAGVKPRPTLRGGGGFTLIELLLVVSIISILAALLLPALSRVKESGKTLVCLNNLKQIGIMLTIYANENQGFFPVGYDVSLPQADRPWYSKLVNGNYMQKTDVLFCPIAKSATGETQADALYWGAISYGKNRGLDIDYILGSPTYGVAVPATLATIRSPAQTILMVDSWAGNGLNADGTPFSWYGFCWVNPWASGNGTGVAWPRHRGICNVLWVDGHVTGVRAPNNNPASIYNVNALSEINPSVGPDYWNR